jgi:Domain of unknown function (DUF4372)/Transposase DDE domain
MYVGKTLFAQVMEFVPWTSFARIVHRYSGNAGARTLSCAEQFRAMAFAQLTWRESLRDIEASLSANAAKLYAMGFRSAVKRSTLADANELRDWRIWSDLAAVLIRRARKLYANDSLGVELDNTVYALDSSTIDLCLSLFDWAPFRSTKAAIKLHTLLDLRGAIPAFIHISDGKLHDVNVLDLLALEAGAFYVMDRGYVDFSRLYTLHQAGAFFVTRAKSPMDARRVYSATTDRTTGVLCDQRVMLNGYYSAKKYPEHLRRIRFKDPESGKTLVFLTNNTALPALTICALYKSRWQVELFFKWIKQHLRNQAFPGQQRERSEDTGVVRRGYLRAHCHRQETVAPRCLALHAATDYLGDYLRKNASATGPYRKCSSLKQSHQPQPIESTWGLTGH